MSESAAATALLALVDPADDTPVIPSRRLRPGTEPDQVSRFADDHWDLSVLDRKETSSAKMIHWPDFPEQLRPSFKRLAWAVINKPTPDVVLSRPGTTARPYVSAGTMRPMVRTWKELAHWLVKQNVTSLDQVDRALLEDYAHMVAEQQNTFPYAANKLFALTRAWAYAPFLLPVDRLCMPPWDDPGAALEDFLGENNEPRGENTTAVIHPATMSPLLIWALRTVTELAPDILAGWQERRRLLTNMPATAGDRFQRRAGRRRIRQYFDELRASGTPVPAYAGHQWEALAKNAVARGGSGRLVAATFIGATLGLSDKQVTTLLSDCPEVMDGQILDDGSWLDVPITGSIDGTPWTKGLDFNQLRHLVLHVSTAALIVISYLSGMRPEEVLHLERGCARREERADGTVRCLVTGRHFKGVSDEHGNTIPEGEVRPEPWTVIGPVHQAIAVVEQLGEGSLLFPRDLFFDPPSWMKRRGEALTTFRAKGRIESFITWANELAAAHGRDHEIIPADPDGAITMPRFRRTVAWFICRRPGGRIALGIQYGHVGSSMTAEGYGGRSRFDMLEILDFEAGLTLADNLSAAAERLSSGEGVSGPAADRYVAAADEYRARYQGGFLTKRQRKALMTNPRLRIYEHLDAILTCNYDPFKALCDPDRGRGGQQRTPSFDRCDRACANISRTDTHIARAQSERQAIAEELADGINPRPIAQRLEQRAQTLEAIIGEHVTTRTGHAPTDQVRRS